MVLEKIGDDIYEEEYTVTQKRVWNLDVIDTDIACFEDEVSKLQAKIAELREKKAECLKIE